MATTARDEAPGRSAELSPDREVEKRIFLVVAALLLPWPSGDAAPRFQLRLLAAPPPIEEASLPELRPPPPPEREHLQELPRVPLPEPVARELVIPVEELAEPEPDAPRADHAPPRRGPPRAPPRRASEAAVRLGLAGLVPPVLLEEPVPDYPRAAEAIGFGAEVVVEALIGRDGRVRSARVVSGPGRFGLEGAARQAVLGRRYTPGRLEGRAVEVLAIIRVRFEPRHGPGR